MSYNLLGLFEIDDVPYTIANVLEILAIIVYMVAIHVAVGNFKEDTDVHNADFDGRIKDMLGASLITSYVAFAGYYSQIFLAESSKKYLACAEGKSDQDVNMFTRGLLILMDSSLLASYALVGASIVLTKSVSFLTDLYINSKEETKDVRDMVNIAFVLQICVLGFRVLKDAVHNRNGKGSEKKGAYQLIGQEA